MEVEGNIFVWSRDQTVATLSSGARLALKKDVAARRRDREMSQSRSTAFYRSESGDRKSYAHTRESICPPDM